jgi:hypothetical protein
MSDDKKPGTLPSWWPSDDTPPAKAPDPAAAPPAAPAQPGASNPAAAAHIANQMPSWWKPEFQTAAKFATPEAPPEPPPVPEAPAAEPATQTAPPVAAAPPPPPPPPPPSNTTAKTMVLPTPQVAPPVAILTVTGGPDSGFKFRIKPNAIATVGRDVESDVVLNDPATSRRHAEIAFKDGAYVLTDLGSANGTLVNDQRIKERALSDRDVIRIGQNVIAVSIARSA